MCCFFLACFCLHCTPILPSHSHFPFLTTAQALKWTLAATFVRFFFLLSYPFPFVSNHPHPPSPFPSTLTTLSIYFQDSRFHSNVIIALHGQDCIGSAGFVAGHATQHWDNDCVVYGTETVTNIFENCWEQVPPGNSPIHGFNNRYYTKKVRLTTYGARKGIFSWHVWVIIDQAPLIFSSCF